jgi:hypothetical protein
MSQQFVSNICWDHFIFLVSVNVLFAQWFDSQKHEKRNLFSLLGGLLEGSNLLSKISICGET